MTRRTAPPLRMPPPQVLWWRAGGGGDAPPPPLVAVVAWMQAQPRHVAAYAALYRRLGAEVCAVLPPVLHMWLEWRALALATCLADALSAELEAHGARPVLLASFSGGPKACTSKLLQLVTGHAEAGGPAAARKYALLASCLCGEAYDSGPVDFLSSRGVRFLAPPGSSSLKLAAAALGARALDAALSLRFAAQRAAYWAALEAGAAQSAPVLLLHSADDELAPEADVQRFAAALRARGRDVTVVTWHSSPHVGHLRLHPMQYEDAAAAWMRDAQARWRGARALPAAEHAPRLTARL